MPSPIPRFDHPMLWPALLVLGLATEMAIALIASFWATRYGVDGWTLGLVVFGLAACCIYLSSQLLTLWFAVGTVPGLSLSLLAAMLAWAGAIAALVGFVFLICLALYSLFGIPGRLVYAGFRQLRAPSSAEHNGKAVEPSELFRA